VQGGMPQQFLHHLELRSAEESNSYACYAECGIAGTMPNPGLCRMEFVKRGGNITNIEQCGFASRDYSA